ncbi:uncharacterized protein EV422DRAFT_373945 [Fimicolochytrium jonesii]|uniref:uncharacterized protein n=1 Tax=Fimicolochytrium jonesii TaxID=1396493 RepID=UPI0022FE9C66|nr:uncharacterized protein EV422DRAFT_373945 [Fimicolochytrium jonesii]KAI8815520.1 hypothetical protein EV422DRAFT_373945 [Fimicolochytrium jonesii]
MSERVHYYTADAGQGWTNDQLKALASMPVSQWYNGNPNFANTTFFTDAAEFNGNTGKYIPIDRGFHNNSALGQFHGYAFCGGHTQLANGSYLVVGGDEFWDKPWRGQNYTSNGRSDIRVALASTDTTGPQLIRVADMYRDPALQPSTPGGSTYKLWGRWYPSVITLPSEEAMIIGGQHYYFDPEHPEADNPTFEMWSPVTGPMGASKRIELLARHFPINMYPVAYVLPKSGNIWIHSQYESVIVDPKTGTETPDVVLDLTKANGLLPRTFPFSGTNFVPMLSYRDDYRMESWLCGGVNGTSPDGTPTPRMNNGKDAWSNCPNCDPVKVCHWVQLETAGAKFTAEDMPIARSQPAAVNLPDGTIAILSGSGKGHQGGVYGQPVASHGVLEAVIFDPSEPAGPNSKRWRVGAPAPVGRHYHNTALLREDGTIFTGGGDSQNGDSFTTIRPDEMTMDVYYPPYTFIPNRPQLALPLNPAAATYGQSLVLTFTTDIASSIQQVSIIRYASMTHTVNLDQRHIELPILKYAKNKVLVKLPASANIAQPGNWMVWAVDSRGAPVQKAGTINLRASNTGADAAWNDAETIPSPTFPAKVRDSKINGVNANAAVNTGAGGSAANGGVPAGNATAAAGKTEVAKGVGAVAAMMAFVAGWAV